MTAGLSRWAAVAASLRLSVDSFCLFRAATRTLEVQDWANLVLRFTPALLDNVAGSGLPLQERCDRFSQAVSYFRFGKIFKLTSRDRTDLADAMVLRLARQHPAPRLLEVGVSDGSSALGLLRQKQQFAEVMLTDRHNAFLKEAVPGGWLFSDTDGKVKLLKFLCFSLDLSPLGLRAGPAPATVETANPVLRAEFGIGSIRRFDMFQDVLAPQVEIIKCANLLNPSYFSDGELRRAVANLARSLREGGHLVVSQNHESYAGGEAAFALQKSAGVLRLVESVHDHLTEPLFREPLPCSGEPDGVHGGNL